MYLLPSSLAGLVLVALPATALPRVLLYTKTAGYRHESIPTAVNVITSLGNGSLTLSSFLVDDSIQDLRWETVASGSEDNFRDLSFLSQFDAIGFLSTTDADPPATGTVLDDEGIRNMATYIENGGGYFGIHSASATLFGAPVYGRLVGAYFDYHPEIQNVSVRPVTTDHPSTSKLPQDGIQIYEEVYNFRSDPRQLVSPAQILLTNASSYQDPGVNPQGFRNGTNGPEPHPLSWYRQGMLLKTDENTDASLSGTGGANIQASGGPGRSWYTSLGHDEATWRLEEFQSHIAGGIGWVLLSDTIKSNNATATVGQGQGSSTSGTNTAGSATASPTSTVPNGEMSLRACHAALLIVSLCALCIILM